MKILVKFFALHRETAGTEEITLEITNDIDIKSLIQEVYNRIPALKGLHENTIVSLNHRVANLSTKLKNGDEIALFPPVSGG
ncbi:MAG: MoaD/ThiS family protein [Thermoplasmata archaeon]